MNTPSLPNPGSKMKSFWAKPEGTTGMIVGVALIIAAVLGLNAILPFIIGLLQNVITAAALCAVVAGVVYVASDKRFRTLLSYGYKSIMRWVTARFIEIDPIGILKSYVMSLRRSRDEMDQQMSNLRGQIRSLQNAIKDNAARQQNALKLAQKAREMHQQPAFVLQARKAGRLKESNVSYEALLQRMEALYQVLVKMREVSEFVLQDIESEVEEQTRKHRNIQAGYSAFRSAVRIMRGDPDQRAVYEQTLEFLAENYGTKLGEIEEFMEVSRGFIASVDLQNQVYEEDAMNMFEAWEKRADQVFMSVQEGIGVPALQAPPEPIVLEADGREAAPVRQHESEDSSGEYDKLFRRDPRNPHS